MITLIFSLVDLEQDSLEKQTTQTNIAGWMSAAPVNFRLQVPSHPHSSSLFTWTTPCVGMFSWAGLLSSSTINPWFLTIAIYSAQLSARYTLSSISMPSSSISRRIAYTCSKGFLSKIRDPLQYLSLPIAWHNIQHWYQNHCVARI